MCDILAASIAVTAGSSLFGFVSQSNQANQVNAQYEANRVSANRTYLNDLSMADIRDQQENAAYQNQAFEAKRDSLRAVGRARAAADTTQGTSVTELFADFERNADERQQNLLYNRNAGALQGSFDRQGLDISRQGRINSAPTANQPSAIGALLSFGGGVLPAVERFGDRRGWWSPASGNRVGYS